MDPKQQKQSRNRGATMWGNVVVTAASGPPRIIATDKTTGQVVWEASFTDNLGEGQILDSQGNGFGATRQQIPHDQHQGDVAKACEGLGLRGEDPFGGKLGEWGCLPLPRDLGPDQALDSQSDYLSLGRISESGSTVHMGDTGNVAPDCGGALQLGLRIDKSDDSGWLCGKHPYVPLRAPSRPDTAIGCQGSAGPVGQCSTCGLCVSLEAASDLESVSRHHIRGVR
jgi:hypothetical protein